MIGSLYDQRVIERAAAGIAAGGVVGFFFNGAYALLGDADSLAAAEAIFRLKRRPRSQTLSLVCDPAHWHEFIDADTAALGQFPLDSAISLHQRLHALGVVYPANLDSAPAELVEHATILNVWTRYEPLTRLHEAARHHGARSLLGASANLSGEPTYAAIEQMTSHFGDELEVIFEPDAGVPAHRRQSVSLIDLTGGQATLLRRGNTTESELRTALWAEGLGELQALPAI